MYYFRRSIDSKRKPIAQDLVFFHNQNAMIDTSPHEATIGYVIC